MLTYLSAWMKPTGLAWSDHRDLGSAVEEAGQEMLAENFHTYRGTSQYDTSAFYVRHVADLDLTVQATEYAAEYSEPATFGVAA